MRHIRKRNPRHDGKPVALAELTAHEWQTIIAALNLTPRQAQVVQLIFQAKKDKQIATALGVNIWTVRAHLTETFTRAGVNDRVELLLHIFNILRRAETLQKPVLQ